LSVALGSLENNGQFVRQLCRAAMVSESLTVIRRYDAVFYHLLDRTHRCTERAGN
jgi:hypothetical protein